FGLFAGVSALVLTAVMPGELGDFAGESFAMPPAESNYLLFMLLSFGMWLLATAGQLFALTVPLAVVLGILAARRGLLDRPAEHRALLIRIAIIGIAIGWVGGALAALQFAGMLFDPAISWGTM